MADVLIFDFETLSGLARTAPIISMGAIACDWEEVSIANFENLMAKGYYRTFKSKRQIIEYGAKPSQSTLDWWAQQSDEAKKVFSDPNKIEIEELPTTFNFYCRDNDVTDKTTVLVRAPHFDFTILEFHYSNLGADIPFNHWKIRDVRSIVDACCGTENGYIPGFKAFMEKKGIVAHNALADCFKDLLQVKMAMTQNFDEMV